MEMRRTEDVANGGRAEFGAGGVVPNNPLSALRLNDDGEHAPVEVDVDDAAGEADRCQAGRRCDVPDLDNPCDRGRVVHRRRQGVGNRCDQAAGGGDLVGWERSGQHDGGAVLAGDHPDRSPGRLDISIRQTELAIHPGVDLVVVQDRVGERPPACPSGGNLVASAPVLETGVLQHTRTLRKLRDRVPDERVELASGEFPHRLLPEDGLPIGVHAAAVILAAERHSLTRTDRHRTLGSHLQPVDARAGDAPPKRNPGSPCQVPTAGRERDHRMLGDKYPRRSRGTDRRRHQSDTRRQRGREHKQATPPPPPTVRRRNHWCNPRAYGLPNASGIPLGSTGAAGRA